MPEGKTEDSEFIQMDVVYPSDPIIHGITTNYS